MPNAGWGGDLNAAKDFHAKVHRPLDNERRDRGDACGRRGGSNTTRRGSSFANTSSTRYGNSLRNGLLTELPSQFWNPSIAHETQSTQDVKDEGRGDPMNVDDRGMDGSQWSSGVRPAAAHAPSDQTRHSAPTPNIWGINTQPNQPGQFASGAAAVPWDSADSSVISGPSRPPFDLVHIRHPEPGHTVYSARDVPASAHQGPSVSSHAALDNNANSFRTNDANDAADCQSIAHVQVTWGPRSTPVSIIEPFKSLACSPVTDQGVKAATKNSGTTSQGTAQGIVSAAETERQWPGLKASRHAVTAAPAGPNGHKQSGALRRDLLQENGMLRGVRFTEDQGPQQDDDWLKTYNLNKVKDKSVLVAKQAFANGDHEAEKALRKVAAACDEVLRAKNVLKDKTIEGEADKMLSKSQNEAWVHWIKFYRPTGLAADSASVHASNKSPNIRMQDAPMAVISQTGQLEVPNATTGNPDQAQHPHTNVVPSASAQLPEDLQRLNFDRIDSGDFVPTGIQQQSTRIAQDGHFDHAPSGGFGSSNSQYLNNPVAQQAQVHTEQPSQIAQPHINLSSGGFGSGDALQSNATAKKTRSAQQNRGPQQPTELTGLPSMFPRGLPAGFDDPQARQIFEDFFFQNKRLPRK
ncbi:hypothetical protein N0V93_005516 [Gnomoniopsis smithogilvyi]|uniref:Uncharacterized protein n=1 Tax=Gnomoniopsis smithogilvyi TaxID=1191159 RepID=A0A9W9CY82_9PEZI|nr:hypothetical protein N0V93_005516 [Gnomoniopsis smithogilvyi]